MSVGFVGGWLILGALAATPPPDCRTPRSAAESLFNGLKEGDRVHASACFDTPPGESGEKLAVQLLQVLDARGHYVPVSSLSVDPDYRADGLARVVPLPESFPVLALTRDAQGDWRYSRETLLAVPGLYADTFSPLSLWFQEQLPPVFYQRLLGLYLWQYLYAALLVLASLVAGQVVRAALKGQVRRLVHRSGFELDDRTYAKTNSPLVLLVMLSVLLWGFSDLQLTIHTSRWLATVLRFGLVLALVFSLSRFLNVGARLAQAWASATTNRLDDQLIPLLQQASQLLLWVIGSFYLADVIGIDVWKLVAGVSIGGLAFALAAQDTVANLFGSVNIFVDRPFQIGDWVKIGGVEGVVEEVGFRSTRVRTFYNSLVTIPNSQITNANVDNLGERARRRVKLTLSLTYDTPPDKVQAYVEGVRAILSAHPHVQASFEVHLHDLGASALEILVYYHLVVPDWHAELVARSQNLLEFLRLAQALEVSFAFPSQSLYLEATPDRPLPPHRARGLGELEAIVASFGPGGALGRPAGVPFQRDWSVQARGEGAQEGGGADQG